MDFRIHTLNKVIIILENPSLNWKLITSWSLKWSNALTITFCSLLRAQWTDCCKYCSCWCKCNISNISFTWTVDNDESCSSVCISPEGRFKNSSSRAQTCTWWSCSDWRDHSRWVQRFTKFLDFMKCKEIISQIVQNFWNFPFSNPKFAFEIFVLSSSSDQTFLMAVR